MSRVHTYIPNLLTLLRIILLVPFIISLANENQIAAIAWAILIISTDYFDGYLARKWNSISDFGKMLDPTADKICSAAVAIALIYYRSYPIWLFIAIVSRDIIILLGGLILIRSRRTVPVSNISGKIAVGFISGSLLAYLLNVEFAKRPLVIVTVLALVISIISYGIVFFRTIRHKANVAAY